MNNLENAIIDPTTGDDNVHGTENNDVFDTSTGGNDNLYDGGGGDDVYWLGAGTGHDKIHEYYNSTNDSGDAVKIKEGYGTDNIRLGRSDDGNDLYIYLVDDAGNSTGNSLVVYFHYTSAKAKIESIEFADESVDPTDWLNASDFALVRITGSSSNDYLMGVRNYSDIFDANTGGNDSLYGSSGNDVYWLGAGTDNDTIFEYPNNSGDNNDVVKIKEGLSTINVSISRSQDGDSLVISLVDGSGANTGDSLTVKNYFTDDSAKIEKIQFANGVTWNAGYIERSIAIRGTSAAEDLYGTNGNDVFNSDAGANDNLYGYGGDDVYWLGSDTDNDTIKEYENNSGDDGDVIMISQAYETYDVVLKRSSNGFDLIIELSSLFSDDGAGSDDSLTVENYFIDDSAKIERVEFSIDGTVWDSDYIEEISTAIRGTNANEDLVGNAQAVDVFDSDAGGNDNLYGRSGNDIYWLGIGTGDDVILEDGNDTGDVIKVEGQPYGTTDNVRLERSNNGDDLVVVLLNNVGVATGDQLTVRNHYKDVDARVEYMEFTDGTVWGLVPIRGTTGDDSYLTGRYDIADIFDSDAGGNDRLVGFSGDDVYWLGAGTDHDTIREDSSGHNIIKIKEGFGREDVVLSRVDKNLVVQLLDNAGIVNDSLTVEDYYFDAGTRIKSVEFADGTELDANDFASARIRGTSDDDYLRDDYEINVFDADVGGNDILYGKSGNDVYWLGAGTDHDTISEHHGNAGDSGDVVRIEADFGTDDVTLERSNHGGANLIIRLLDDQGLVTDSLTVENFYTDASAKIESIEFANETVNTDDWFDADDLAALRIRGTSADDNNLYGAYNSSDVFDTDAGGNDTMRGFSGDDVYWLGSGTGHDTINEYYYNSGDDGDVIKIKSGFGPDDIRLSRSNYGENLVVQLLDSAGVVTDSLTVENYYSDASAKIESIEFNDGTVWSTNDIADLSWLRGTSADDNLYGAKNGSDIFDSDAGGNDNLRGRGGNDVYWLGAGTGHDVIQEYYYNLGDDGDVIKIEEGFGTDNVLLGRSSNGLDLIVKLLDDTKAETGDSLTVQLQFADSSASYYLYYMQGSMIESIEFNDGTVWDTGDINYILSQIKGTSSDESLYGNADVVDIFDADAGGNDILYGYSGNDVYWLGAGTGHDVIQEYYYNLGDDGDVIKIEEGFGTDNVLLERSSGNALDLIITLLDDNGLKTEDSLTVKLHFADSSESYYKNYMEGSTIESIEFNDGTVWNTDDIDSMLSQQIRGTSADDDLYGDNNVTDVFNSDAGGNDNLRGRSGNDVYWLGDETDNDVIQEYYYNLGDDGDVIKIEEGYGVNNLRLEISSNGLDLIVKLLDSTGAETGDSLTVDLQFADSSASYYKDYMQGSAVEQIEADGHVLLSSQYTALINEIAAFEDGTSTNGYNGVAEVNAHFWQDESTISNQT